MSDDEDDYMSDKFLAGVPDVRPSLVQNRGKKRQIHMELKHKEHVKKQKDTKAFTTGTLNNEKLQQALNKPLETENKGFKLLTKMGYKPGEALGKKISGDDAGGSGRLLVPIGMTIKADRQGLGRETALKELNERRMQIRMERLKKETGCGENSIEEFRRRATQKAEEKFVENAIRQCQKTCENLDLECQIEAPALSWFWPENPKEPEDDDDDTKSTEAQDEIENDSDEEMEVDFSNVEKLEMLTNYVRTSYNFCFWCGVRYENSQDLENSCPGPNKDDH